MSLVALIVVLIGFLLGAGPTGLLLVLSLALVAMSGGQAVGG